MGLREDYQIKADAQLLEWQAWIEQEKLNLNEHGFARTANSPRVMQRLEDSCRVARVRLEELRSAQDERWEFAKQAVEQAMIELKRALDESGAGSPGKIIQLQTSRSRMSYPFGSKKG